MEEQTAGTVISVSRQWWCKVNRRPARTHPLDGAEFPHVVKIKYTAGGKDHICRKWLSAGIRPPEAGSAVRVLYAGDRPAKARADI